jgi:hypothetical protein
MTVEPKKPPRPAACRLVQLKGIRRLAAVAEYMWIVRAVAVSSRLRADQSPALFSSCPVERLMRLPSNSPLQSPVV